MSQKKFYFINNSQISPDDLSGGERIAIELARQWSDRIPICLCTSKFGIAIWDRHGLKKINKIQWGELRENVNIFFSYLRRAFSGCRNVRLLEGVKDGRAVVYSASDFWPDSLAGFVAKLCHPGNVWIAGFYMSAPAPWSKDNPYKGKRWARGLFYWATQVPVYWLIKKYADFVFVTSDPDVAKFVTKKRNKNRVIVIKGGVDTVPSCAYLCGHNFIRVPLRKYDACFIGRFHYQKGVLGLIDIWKKICEKKPNAQLVMIGFGPLESEVRQKISVYHLQENISLLGYMDGAAKYEVFKNSKIVVHPATYDSGGMAAAEAMAWGLPGVSFDLEALKTYYPKGMIKIKCFDQGAFVDNILNLLHNENLYKKISADAVALVNEEWDWQKRAMNIYEKISGVL